MTKPRPTPEQARQMVPVYAERVRRRTAEIAAATIDVRRRLLPSQLGDVEDLTELMTITGAPPAQISEALRLGASSYAELVELSRRAWTVDPRLDLSETNPRASLRHLFGALAARSRPLADAIAAEVRQLPPPAYLHPRSDISRPDEVALLDAVLLRLEGKDAEAWARLTTMPTAGPLMAGGGAVVREVVRRDADRLVERVSELAARWDAAPPLPFQHAGVSRFFCAEGAGALGWAIGEGWLEASAVPRGYRCLPEGLFD